MSMALALSLSLSQPLWVDFRTENSKQSREIVVLTMAEPVKNEKKKVALFQERKVTIKAPVKGNGSRTSQEDVKTLCKQGRLKEALHILKAMDRPLDSSTYICLLQACIKKKALPEGKLVHGHMNERGMIADRILYNTLVNMYAKCGSLVEARRIFDQISKRDSFLWTVMIAAYARNGLAEEALALFHQMRRTGIRPSRFTFASVLPACASLASLEHGMKIHEDVIRNGFQCNVFVESALIDMYAKCGSIEKARDVFDKMHQRDVVAWNTMIAAYTRQGLSEEALELFAQMQRSGTEPDQFTFSCVLPVAFGDQCCSYSRLGAIPSKLKYCMLES